MKYKPTRTPITKALIESKEYGWAVVSGIAELLVVANEAKQGRDYWSCGKCGSALNVQGGRIPQVCAKCGGEISWVDIRTRLIKVCPKCSTPGELADAYCARHAPAVKLVDREVPL
jgi:ribosomal protein S27AE